MYKSEFLKRGSAGVLGIVDVCQILFYKYKAFIRKQTKCFWFIWKWSFYFMLYPSCRLGHPMLLRWVIFDFEMSLSSSINRASGNCQWRVDWLTLSRVRGRGYIYIILFCHRCQHRKTKPLFSPKYWKFKFNTILYNCSFGNFFNN